jgi:hypothetical protein
LIGGLKKASYSNPSCFLILATRNFGSSFSLPCIGSIENLSHVAAAVARGQQSLPISGDAKSILI